MTAVLYARFSPRPKDKLNTLTLDVQLERMRAYCEQHGLVVGPVFREPETSASIPLEKRPKGAELVAAIQTGEIDHVVAYSLDRLFRRDVEALETIEAWHKAGLGVHILDFGGMMIDTTTPMGRLILAVVAAIGQFLRADTARRTSDALRSRQRRGLATGNPPYGWERKTIGSPIDLGDGKLIQETVLVCNANEQRALSAIKAAHQLGMSSRRIAEEMNKAGAPTRGARWTHRTVGRILKRAEAGLEPGTCSEAVR